MPSLSGNSTLSAISTRARPVLRVNGVDVGVYITNLTVYASGSYLGRSNAPATVKMSIEISGDEVSKLRDAMMQEAVTPEQKVEVRRKFNLD